MNTRTVRVSIIAATLALLLGGTAQPVLADTELGHTGTVGVHSLRDTSLDYGASCRYKYLSFWTYGQLRRIDVKAPRVRAVAGNSAQQVGWKFTVQRRMGGFLGWGPWSNRFTSTEVTATTSDAVYAPFTDRSATVDVPFGPDAEDVAVVYRVIVIMLWHRPNGSIQGTARHRVNHYGSYYTNAAGAGYQHNGCSGYWAHDW